ncbi:unnamed protein product [Arabidopsis halleri]
MFRYLLDLAFKYYYYVIFVRYAALGRLLIFMMLTLNFHVCKTILPLNFLDFILLFGFPFQISSSIISMSEFCKFLVDQNQIVASTINANIKVVSKNEELRSKVNLYYKYTNETLDLF